MTKGELKTSGLSSGSLPDFGPITQTKNADPLNASVPVNTPLDIKYHGENIHLTQGASRSAMAMIEYFSRPEVTKKLKGSQALELGSGTGLAGIAATIQGAKVDFTDQSIVMEVLKTNVQDNLSLSQLQRSGFHELQWHADHQDHPLIYALYDYIIAADVVYARESIQPLVDTLDSFSQNETVIFLAYVQRFPWARDFFELMEEKFDRTLLLQANGVWLFQFKKIQNMADVIDG